MRILLVEPLEPLVLSRTPIAGQEFIVSSHRVLPVPPSTTIAGLLGMIYGVALGGYRDLGHVSLLRKLLEELEGRGCRRPIFKGPLVWFKDLSDEPYVCLPDLCTPLDRVVVERRGNSIEAYVDRSNCDTCVEFDVEERIGVKLARGYGVRIEKVVDKGYMYRYSMLKYRRIGDSRSATPTFLYTLNCADKISPDVYRVGGEGRMARVETVDIDREPGRILERIAKVMERLENPIDMASGGLHIALTPVPLIPLAGERPQLVLDSVKPSLLGLEFVEEIVGVIPVERGAKPKRRVERLSLGYSEVLNARRPQILALPAGTIIKTRRQEKIEETLETLWSLGLPTLLRLL